ncbi:MAG: FAD-dependent oxidoreductase [Dehalococcoidia bacterium]
MQQSADVVVIGGGVVGCAAAYFLSEAGAKVLIVERDALGSGASGHAPGGLGVPLSFFEPPEHAHFIRQAINFLKWMGPRIAAETDIDILLRELPWLEVARSQGTWDYLQEWAPRVGRKLLDAQEVRRLEPRLAPDAILGGALEEGDGQVDSYRLTLAYVKGAEKRGAQVFLGEVSGLERSGGRVTAVVTSNGTIGCNSVVLAMGAWTGHAEKWVDFPLPISPLKGDMMYLKPKDDRFWPFWVMSHDDTEEGQEVPVALHMQADGLVSTGTTVEPGLFDNIPTEAARNGMMERAIRFMPCIAESELVRHVCGPRPNPPDGTAVLGPVPGLEGVYIAVALLGVMCSALMGRITADLIFQRPLPVPIDLFDPRRLIEPSKGRYGYYRYL